MKWRPDLIKQSAKDILIWRRFYREHFHQAQTGNFSCVCFICLAYYRFNDTNDLGAISIKVVCGCSVRNFLVFTLASACLENISTMELHLLSKKTQNAYHHSTTYLFVIRNV